MIYDHNLTLIVPVDRLAVAKSINRHLDRDDVGGGDGFSARVSKDGVIYAVYSRLCDAAYASQAAMLVTVPEELHALCLADSRFDDKPSLAECAEFCSVALCFVDTPPEGFEPVVEEAANVL